MSTYIATKLTPMLESHDMQATLKFYTEVLNFTCDVKLDDLTWLTLRKDEIEIMFCSPNKHHNIPKSIMSGSLYINTNEVTTLWKSLKDQCEICYPLEILTMVRGSLPFTTITAIHCNSGRIYSWTKSHNGIGYSLFKLLILVHLHTKYIWKQGLVIWAY